jgi:hypothetical protein
MESGRYVAHQVARSLGRDHALPAVAAATPRPPPAAPVPLAAASVAAVVAALKDRIAAISGDELRAWGRAARTRGGGGFASWLRDAVADELRRRGHLDAAADHAGVLHAVRDFVVATIGHARGDAPAADPAHGASIASHAAEIDDHLAAKLS